MGDPRLEDRKVFGLPNELVVPVYFLEPAEKRDLEKNQPNTGRLLDERCD